MACILLEPFFNLDYERMAEILLKHGANPNNQNSQGSTPLFVASNYGKENVNNFHS